ncbi:MAG: metallopeptidase TldD-related protein [Candidatus Odinarchaeota archaeon]
MAVYRKKNDSVFEEQIEIIARDLLLLAEENKSQIEIFFLRAVTEKMKGGGHARISGEHIEDAGLSIRVLKRGRIGTAATSLPAGQDLINSIFKEAIGNIEVRRAKRFELEQFSAYGVDLGEHDHFLYNKDILRISEDDLIDLTAQLASVAYMVPDGQSIASEVSKTVEYVRVINSNGCNKSSMIGWLEGKINLSVERHTSLAVSFAEECSRNELKVHQIGADSLRSAEMYLQKHQLTNEDLNVKTGEKLPLIWSSNALSDLLAFTLVPALRSRKLLRVDHPFLATPNQEIAPGFVNIYDDPLRHYGIGSAAFDDAGNTLDRWDLIKAGVQEHFISDLGRQSVFRKSYFERISRSYRHSLNIFPTNLIIKLDQNYLVNNIIEHCPRGLYIKSIVGGHGSNIITGDFSIGLSEAYLIRNGVLEGPVNGEMNSNIFTLLRGTCLGSKTHHEEKPLNAPYGIVLPEMLIECPTKEIRIQLQ